MNQTRVTFRRIVTFVACGLAGAVLGGFVAKAAIRYFAGSPVWELPAIICGSLALCVVAVLIVAPVIGAKAPKHK